MKSIAMTVLVLISWGFFFVLGGIVGTYQTYTHAVPMIEERVVRRINFDLQEYGIKKFWWSIEDGLIRMRIKTTKGGYELWKKQESRIAMGLKSKSLTSSTSSSTGGPTVPSLSSNTTMSSGSKE